MNIVYCLDVADIVGGVQRVTFVKANALAEIQGNRVYVIVIYSSSKQNPCFELSDKVERINMFIDKEIPDFKQTRLNKLYHSIQNKIIIFKKLRYFLNKINPDVIVYPGGDAFLPIALLSRRYKKIREYHAPVSNIWQDYRKGQPKGILSDVIYLMKKNITSFVEKYFYSAVVVLSHQQRERKWKNRTDVFVIGNPIAFFPQETSTCEEKMVVSVGRLSRQKGFDLLLNAWSLLSKKNQDWKLVIWGDGELKEELDQQIRSLNIGDSVQLKGETRDVVHELLKASIFVSSSRFEGFPLVALEAMGVGLPCVCFDFPKRAQEINNDGEDSIVVPEGDIQQMARALELLMDDKSMRKSMGRKAREHVTKWEVKHIIDSWMQLFNKLKGNS